MRALLVILAAGLAVPATAGAQLPSTTTSGVKVTHGAGGRITIGFKDTPAGRRAYKPFAGRLITVRCQRVGDLPIGTGPTGIVSTRVRMGQGISTVELRARGNVNLCLLGSVIVATDQTARRFLADVVVGQAVLAIGDQLDSRGAARTLRRLHSHGVRLSRAGATPSRRRIGIYGDRGRPNAIVAVSASGRRLFVERTGEVLRTNVLGLLDQLARGQTPSGVALPLGDQPPAGTPLPDTSDPEVTESRAGDRVAVDFSGTARNQVSGARVQVNCTRESRGLAIVPTETHSVSASGPPAGQPLRVTVPPRFHVCAVGFRGRVVRIALDQTGRVALEEGTVAAGLLRVLRNAATDADTGYPSAQALSDRYAGAVAALAAPTDSPPDRRIGAWSDSAKRLVLTATARTGRRIFFEIDGRVVRTNAFNVPSLPDA